jgi:hypothetical protein
MSFKSRVFALAATAAIALGIAAPAMADDSETFSFTITSGSQFSVEITHFDSTFGNAQFTLGVQNSSTVASASYVFKVIDLRGTGAGWNVKASSTGFFNTTTNDEIQGAALHSSNNTPWASNIPADPDGFYPAPGSIEAGVTATSAWTPSLIGAGRVLLKAAPGTPDSIPNGTGTFSDEEALYLDFPNAIAVGTYTATVLLTLTSGAP